MRFRNILQAFRGREWVNRMEKMDDIDEIIN